MGTPAGFAAFRHDAINAMFRKILRAWCDFLSSPESLYVINDSPRGWKCASARKSTRIEQFQYKPREKHWGFASWNDYFTRRFKPGQRPIADPDDDKVIVNACESTPYALKTNVKRQDRFWVKAQPYSLQDMLAGDESAEQFVGGTVYQAFLDAHNYHRWHSPVTGTIRKAFVREGTYYSEAESEGEDPEGPKRSQGYLAHVATRAIILIESDDPVIGLVCLMFGRHGRGLVLRHPSRDPAGPPGEERGGSRLFPVRRFDLLPHLPSRRHRGIRRRAHSRSPTTRILRSSCSGRRSPRRTRLRRATRGPDATPEAWPVSRLGGPAFAAEYCPGRAPRSRHGGPC